MGIKNARPKLFDAIERESVMEVEMLLDKYPELLNEAFFDDGVFNCVIRAAWRGDVKMLKMLHKKGADLNLGVNDGYAPLMWTAIRGKKNAMRYLVEKGKVSLEICDSEGLTPLDNAIVNGYYEVARYLKEKGLREKSIEFYNQKNDNFLFDQVNVEAFLESLKDNQEEMTESAFMDKEEEEELFNDPVIDPRQSYSEIFHRMKSFQAPKIVERSELPPELQKKNSLFTMASSIIYSHDLTEKKSNAPRVKKVLKDVDFSKNDEFDNALDRGEIEIFESNRGGKKEIETPQPEVAINDEDFEIGSPDNFVPGTFDDGFKKELGDPLSEGEEEKEEVDKDQLEL